MNKLDFQLAKLLIREQRYFSLKGFSRKNITRISRPITSYVRRNYIASIISFSILSLGLAAIKILEIPGPSTLSEVIVVLFFYLVIAGSYNALFYFSQIKMANIIEPSIHLPRVRTERALILSYIYYYGSSTLFVVLPAAFIYAFLFKNVIEFFIILWWAGIYSVLALLAGSIALVATGGNMFRRKAGKKKYAKSIVRIAAILFAFFFFEFWIYDPTFLPPNLFDHFNAIIAFIPVSTSLTLPNIILSLLLFLAWISHIMFPESSDVIAKFSFLRRSFIVSCTCDGSISFSKNPCFIII